MPSSVLFMFMSVQVAVLQWVRAGTSNCSQQTDTLLPIYFSFLCTYFSNSRGLSFLMWEIGKISSSLKCFSKSKQNHLFKVHDAWQYGDSDFFFFFLLIRHYQKHHILTRCLLILLLVKGIWCFIIRLLTTFLQHLHSLPSWGSFPWATTAFHERVLYPFLGWMIMHTIYTTQNSWNLSR